MLDKYLEKQIRANFPHTPTPDQDLAMSRLAAFLTSPRAEGAFILRGYAGTGKTSLVGALVHTLDALQQKCVLLAPTGRAAKVFAAYASHTAFTIHKRIYRQRAFTGEGGNFALNDNLATHTLFIVDEASMIANEGLSGTMFGTGRLLDDLIHFVYSGQGCRLLLTGDVAQLPPVGEEQSPALQADNLRGYGLEVSVADLTQVVRQEQASGILWNATRLRRALEAGEVFTLPRLRVEGFDDIRLVPGNELIDALEECYARDGMDETIVICRSNKRANIYNEGIRQRILWREEELEAGDILMVAKNNYYWTEKDKRTDFIANGEMAIVRRVRRTRQLYGFRFADVTLRFPDNDDREQEVCLLLDTLRGDAPALTREEADRLFHAVLEDYADVPTKSERIKRLKSDPYYNALQAKYAYAVTCHKAQGGQWRNVFLDQAYMPDEYLTPDFFRWLYTAFTRATGTLYLVNYPGSEVEK